MKKNGKNIIISAFFTLIFFLTFTIISSLFIQEQNIWTILAIQFIIALILFTICLKMKLSKYKIVSPWIAFLLTILFVPMGLFIVIYDLLQIKENVHDTQQEKIEELTNLDRKKELHKAIYIIIGLIFILSFFEIFIEKQESLNFACDKISIEKLQSIIDQKHFQWAKMLKLEDPIQLEHNRDNIKCKTKTNNPNIPFIYYDLIKNSYDDVVIKIRPIPDKSDTKDSHG